MRNPIAHGSRAHNTHYLDFVHKRLQQKSALTRPREHAGDIIPASRSIGGLDQLRAGLF